MILCKPENININLRDRFVNLFLVSAAFQCLHFVEEFIIHLYQRLPQLLGVQPWSAKFFVAFNLSWISIWILSAIGLKMRSVVIIT